MVAELQTQKREWTYSDLLALNDEKRYELHDGELIEMTAPKLKHQKLLRRLMAALEPFVAASDLGEIYLAPHDLYISETTFFEPDLSFVRRERFANESIEREDDACLIAPPDLIVEIISPSTASKDRVQKLNAYARFGVRHYWILDPTEKTLLAHVLQDGRYAIVAALCAETLEDEDTGFVRPPDQMFAPSLFPGLQISLTQLFT